MLAACLHGLLTLVCSSQPIVALGLWPVLGLQPESERPAILRNLQTLNHDKQPCPSIYNLTLAMPVQYRASSKIYTVAQSPNSANKVTAGEAACFRWWEKIVSLSCRAAANLVAGAAHGLYCRMPVKRGYHGNPCIVEAAS
jgi:hypothetical protein